jgi:hypothetical protein
MPMPREIVQKRRPDVIACNHVFGITGWLGISQEGRYKGRVFFFVNKKEAKKTLLVLDRAGEAAWGELRLKETS